jgi:hypothetical protein
MAEAQRLPEIPQELIQQLERGNVVLLIGAGLSIGAGLLSWPDLVSPLAEAIDLREDPPANPLKVAQYFENEKKRHALVDHICQSTDSTKVHPSAVHDRLLKLPCKTWITTNYDDLLEQTLRAGGRKFNLVVRDTNLPYTSEDALTLIKLHGDRLQQDTLVITERDYQTYFHRYPWVRSKLSLLLLERTLLLIGYSISDPDFNQILAEITYDLGEHGRRAYAILINADPYALADLRERNIEVLNLVVEEGEDPSTGVGEILDVLIQHVSDRAQAPALPAAEEPAGLVKRIAQAVTHYKRQMAQAVRASPDAEQPYRELLPFRIEDQRIFFGRDEARDHLYRHMLKDRLAVLHAKSGAGKTSLLNAGLTPFLIQKGHLPVFVRDYDDPVAAIKRAIAPGYDGWPTAWQTQSLPDFLTLVCRKLGGPQRKLVLILDQFEEFFILQPDVEPRRPFFEALVRCYHDSRLPLHIIIALRKDYFADLMALKSHLPSVLNNACTLAPLTRQQAQIAITGPIAALGREVRYEQELLDVLLDDLARGGMELPHLQIICSRLFDSVFGEGATQEPTEITLEVYKRLGGESGILSSYLNHVLEGLTSVDAVIAKRILVSFIGYEPTRQVLSASSLAAKLDLDQRGAFDRVLGHLVEARLLQCDQSGGVRRYEMAHEYLSDEVRTWLTEEDWARKRLEEKLHGEVASWQDDRSDIAKDRLDHLYEQRKLLVGLDADTVRCLVASSLAAGKELADWEEVAGGAAAMQRTLADIAVDGSVRVTLRAAAADALDGMNGSRAGLGLSSDGLPEIEWCEVPAGEFRIGLPGHQQSELIDKPYLIGKYPITNTQYEAFVRDGGYTEKWEGCWTEEGRAWKKSSIGATKIGRTFDLPSHPVVQIEWHEAVAFCRWLSERVGRTIDLPTEAQWEKAARGTDGRLYPWGNELKPGDKCANYNQTGIGCTTAAGIFPEGASPYGVQDMSGNAWEWCHDRDGTGGVLRGGSFDLGADYMQCAFRLRFPIFGAKAVGFRVTTGPTA